MKVRPTLNRTAETNERYRKHIAEKENTPVFLENEDRVILKEYEHWFMTENKFPYDAIFSKHDMIVSKRKIPSLAEANPEEMAELQKIKNEHAAGGVYDGILENFPKNQSKPGQYHIHLFIWKLVEN